MATKKAAAKKKYPEELWSYYIGKDDESYQIHKTYDAALRQAKKDVEAYRDYSNSKEVVVKFFQLSKIVKMNLVVTETPVMQKKVKVEIN